MSSKIAASLVVVALLAGATSARAQPSQSDAAIAQELFDEARELMKHASYTEACAKLAESQRLDPAEGTLLNLARCHELAGRLATAWTEYKDALTQVRRSGNAKRELFARQRLADVEPKLSHLTVVRSDDDPAVIVEIDGAVLGAASLGAPMPVDPGAHTITAHAPNKQPFTQTVRIAAVSDNQRVAIPALEAAPNLTQGGGFAPTPSSLPPPTGDVPSPLSPPHHAPAPAPARTPDRTAAYALFGGGAAALGVGVIAGLTASAKWSDRNAACTQDACTGAGLDADHAARRWAAVSDVAFGAAIVAVGVGAYLYLTAKPPPSLDVRVGVSSVSIAGRF